MLGAWLSVFLDVRMRVGMCDRDCVCLFFVSGWVFDYYLSWISLSPPLNVGPISSPPHYLPVVGVSARWCTCGSRCPGLGTLVCVGSLPVAAFQGLDPWALLGLCLGMICPGVSGLWVHG
ncbi:hypothetical protein ATANTOWER_013627 [Ataeniobius toweri]|uniref:Uncharacterized protein n=1 Tax=Ataeniobius toweri TaxID=208326 RepID=A0ABU7CHE4_9TELE|nr:hypothetical protein [Ataeniobius toweri]